MIFKFIIVFIIGIYAFSAGAKPCSDATARSLAKQAEKTLKGQKYLDLEKHLEVQSMETGDCDFQWLAKTLGHKVPLVARSPDCGVVLVFMSEEHMQRYAAAATVFTGKITLQDEDKVNSVPVCGRVGE